MRDFYERIYALFSPPKEPSMNLAAFLAAMQALMITTQATAQAMHQANVGGKTDQSHFDAAVSIFGLVTGAVATFSQAFHAANGGTPVATPIAPPQPPQA